MSAKSEDKKAIRILSFDNGGPGTYSQLLIVKEYMARIAYDFGIKERDVYPADYFDLMGGVGFGGLAALLLGHLRMDVDQATDTLLSIATTIPSAVSDDQVALEANTNSLRNTVNEAIEECGIALDVKMEDERLSSKCKVAIYAASVANLSHPVIFRTYSRRGSNTNLTIVEAICSTLATPSTFAPVVVGKRPRQQKYVGGVLRANNPTRELLKEAGNIFGEDTCIAQVLSLGTGRPQVFRLSNSIPSGVSRVLEELTLDCEGVAADLSAQLSGVEAYLRLNVDRGMERLGMHEWDDLGPIETHTSAYMNDPTIQAYVEASLRRIYGRVGPVTLREINYSNSQLIRAGPAPPTDIVARIAVASDIITLLKALCEWLRELHSKYTIRVNKDLGPLLKRLKFHLATVENQIAKLEEDVQVDLPAPSLNPDITGPIKAYVSLSIQFTDAEGNIATTTQIIGDMDTMLEKYTIALHRSVDGLATQGLSQFQLEISKDISKAHFNPTSSVYGNQHIPCLQGTRQSTLQAIRHWANDDNAGNRMFCLLDVAGSGKSTVAKTMADQWTKEKRLVARYFFSRDTVETMSTKSFCSTVANAFAACNNTFKASMEEYMKLPNWHLLPLEEQFEGLVAGPLRNVRIPAILMIDALDECGKEHGVRRTLLETLRSQFHSISLLRIFVTGRPEPDIKRWAVDELGVGYTSFAQLEGTNNDVETYIRSRLQELPDVRDRLYPVIRYADGLFIWARIACDLLLQAIDVNSLLETLGKEVSLDYLYEVALKQSMPEDKASQATMIMVLQMILAAREPLSIAQLDRLSAKQGIVEPVVTRLSSLLLHQSREDPIRLLHATLREFLISQENAGRYYIQPGLGHYRLALGCIRVISHQSEQDISNLTQLDAASARIFHYSSGSWVHHCINSYRKLGLNGVVLEFVNGGLESWLDVDVADCVENILALCHQNMSPRITEILVNLGLGKEYHREIEHFGGSLWQERLFGYGFNAQDGIYFRGVHVGISANIRLKELKDELRELKATLPWLSE